jgi:hypothetical protein
MKSLSLLVLLLAVRKPPLPESTQVQTMLTQVVNAPGLAPFLGHYRQRPIYFRFLPTDQYSTNSLHALHGLVLRLQQGGKLVYDETKDVKRSPVIEFRFVKRQPTSAEVWVGFDIEGVVGQFTLGNSPEWHLTSAQVYEI